MPCVRRAALGHHGEDAEANNRVQPNPPPKRESSPREDEHVHQVARKARRRLHCTAQKCRQQRRGAFRPVFSRHFRGGGQRKRALQVADIGQPAALAGAKRRHDERERETTREENHRTPTPCKELRDTKPAVLL